MISGSSTSALVDASPETAEMIEREVHDILASCHQRARDILVANRPIVEEMSDMLLEEEVLDGDRMQAFLARVTQAADLAVPPGGERVVAS